jgi:hypothetical protein
MNILNWQKGDSMAKFCVDCKASRTKAKHLMCVNQKILKTSPSQLSKIEPDGFACIKMRASGMLCGLEGQLWVQKSPEDYALDELTKRKYEV